jgi:hypothetical protein
MQSSLEISSHLPNNLKTVIDKFTPEILGMFWITDDELNRELLGFDEFNYLFDGLISQYLYGQQLNGADLDLDLDKSNIFYTQNFNSKVFLAHIKMHGEVAGVLDEQISLIQENKSGGRNKILLFNTTSKFVSNDLIKRYPQFIFVEIELYKE